MTTNVSKRLKIARIKFLINAKNVKMALIFNIIPVLFRLPTVNLKFMIIVKAVILDLNYKITNVTEKLQTVKKRMAHFA
jgi:hypothetical protein